jgi:hypothetical protein
MNAKFGKISIGFFLAPLPIGFLFSWIVGGDDLFLIYAVLMYVLLWLSGTICGIIGMKRKEKPKAFYFIGLLLNSILLFYSGLGLLVTLVSWIRW